MLANLINSWLKSSFAEKNMKTLTDSKLKWNQQGVLAVMKTNRTLESAEVQSASSGM